MHLALSASLYQLVAASLRPRLAMRARFLSAHAVFWVCLVSLTASFAAAQGGADVNESFRQATLAMREGRLDEAREGFAAIVKEIPSFAEAHLNLGLVLQEQKRFDEAIASFQKALILKPKLRGANLFLGVALFRLNQPDKAVVAIQKETAAYPKDPAAWMWLGVIELAKDQPEEAAAALDKAAQLAPDDMDVLYYRGRAHLFVSKNSYGRMFKVDPRSWRVYQVMAQANAEADRHVDAIAEYQEAIKLAPTQPGLHEELGSEYSIAAKPLDAEAAFQRELEIDPHNVLARYKLGVLYIAQGDGARAKGFIEAAANQEAGLRHLDYNLGRAEMLLGNDAAAAQRLERATSAPGSDPEVIQQAWYQLGIVYRHLHRMEDAQKAMAMFQKLKDAAAEASQQSLAKFKNKQGPNAGEPPPAPEKPR